MTGQLVHCGLYCIALSTHDSLWYPSGHAEVLHARHCVAASMEYWPLHGTHLDEPAEYANVPAGHGVHHMDPSYGALYPAMQLVHAAALEDLPETDPYIPALHGVQYWEADATEYDPAAHATQVAAFVATIAVLAVPATQLSHAVLLVEAAYVPALQLVHAYLPSSPLYVPTLHASHTLAPVPLM